MPAAPPLSTTPTPMKRPDHRAQITAALQQYGPMTAAEIADHLELAPHKVAAAIGSARYQSPGVFFRILRYLPVTGRRGRDVCVFVAGEGEDAPRQPFTAAKQAKRRVQAKARYYEKHKSAMNARNTARKAALAGRALAVNPWLQLAAPSARATVSRMAKEMSAVR